ncbi:hypothetical protein FPV67DRAFT_1473979 [Lyophyllum atratum]|nr:hypothetical protein FPV67DRAFT_1473979 [Lyophyllum atratum]
MYPLWEVSGLESLSLLGAAWVDKSNAQHIIRMLQRSPDIEFLEVPTELRGFSTCRFPRLKRLKLSMVSGAVTPTTTTAPNTLTSSQPTDSPLTAFLEAHPTIEELNWSPLGALTLAPGALPALKRLKGPRQIMHALEDPASSSVPASPPPSQPRDEPESEGGSMRRPIEALDIWGLAASRLATSRTLDPSALRSLRLEHVGPLESIYALAARFTGITWLSMPAHHLTLGDMYPALIRLVSGFSPFVCPADWLDLLPRFPLLEVFRGPGIWESVGGGGSPGANDRMHGAILELVARCPRLRRLDHWQVYEKRRGVKVVRIYREGAGGGDGERVWYEVGKPRARWVVFRFCLTFWGGVVLTLLVFVGTCLMRWRGRLISMWSRGRLL